MERGIAMPKLSFDEQVADALQKRLKAMGFVHAGKNVCAVFVDHHDMDDISDTILACMRQQPDEVVVVGATSVDSSLQMSIDLLVSTGHGVRFMMDRKLQAYAGN